MIKTIGCGAPGQLDVGPPDISIFCVSYSTIASVLPSAIFTSRPLLA